MLRSISTPKRPNAPRRVSLSAGGKKTIALQESAKRKSAERMKEGSLDTAVMCMTEARNASASGCMKRGTMTGILESAPTLTRDMIYAHEKKRRRTTIVEEEGGNTEANISNPAVLLNNSDDNNTNNNVGGRPKGSTNAAKHDRESREAAARTHAVDALKARWAGKKPGGRLEKHALRDIIEAAKKKFNVEDLLIGEHMIKERASRGQSRNPTGRGPSTPMLEIEPLLVTFCICMQRIGQPLGQEQFLELANSLIKGSPIEAKVLASKRGGTSGAANGTRYYKNFMKRNSKELSSKCPRKFPADRTKWTTHSNISAMYDMVYAVLVEAGVARSATLTRAANPWRLRQRHLGRLSSLSSTILIGSYLSMRLETIRIKRTTGIESSARSLLKKEL
jgi:hypothetical protein